jgi:tetratricopeptide (TPR) repeat protein
MERCFRLIEAGQFEAARARLEPIVAAHPRWQRALFLLALAHHEQKRYGEARPLFARALAADPSSADVLAIRLHYAWCLYYLGDAEGARREFESFVAERADYADAHFGLGLIAFDADDVAGATERFETAIRLAQAAGDVRREGKARARLADVLVRTGELTRARTELETAVKLRPDAYEAYFKLSRVLERLGDAEGAARALELHHSVREQVRRSGSPTP